VERSASTLLVARVAHHRTSWVLGVAWEVKSVIA
jgi:hypothetical protein